MAIYLSSIMFYYPCVAVGKSLVVAGFLAGSTSKTLQISTTQKRKRMKQNLIILTIYLIID